MKTLNRLLALAALSTAAVTANAGTFANISPDGNLTDWSGISSVYTDPAGDGSPGDINQVFLANNDTHFFILVTFNAEVNPQALGGFYFSIDNDSNTATGFNVYGAGIVGSEAAWHNDTAFEQGVNSEGSTVFDTGAATSGANAGISPFGVPTTFQEISISRSAIIDVANNQTVFPNNSFTIALYFNGGVSDDITNAIAYSFASASAVPEPSTYAAFAGAGVLALAILRRRNRRQA